MSNNIEQENSDMQETTITSSTGKRLFQYGMLYKNNIIIALIFLIIAVSAEVVGPIIAKKMIDNHITGINQTWYYVDEGTPEASSYQQKYLLREDRITDQPTYGSITFEQKGLTFYLIEQGASEQEKVLLTKEEVYQFYKYEIPYIIKLSAF
ncbi:MAG TPA: hypothetical protein IAA29_03370, partial [Candidatus Paenibacillus intestinavium]|nr:hypothetical protein [Candidatus Paenibacillus intestinavium]